MVVDKENLSVSAIARRRSFAINYQRPTRQIWRGIRWQGEIKGADRFARQWINYYRRPSA
jgi:hypothetical protein